MYDWTKKNNGKWNVFGMKIGYAFKKAKVTRMRDCDPLKPGKCPKDLPVCVKYTVLDANL